MLTWRGAVLLLALVRPVQTNAPPAAVQKPSQAIQTITPQVSGVPLDLYRDCPLRDRVEVTMEMP